MRTENLLATSHHLVAKPGRAFGLSLFFQNLFYLDQPSQSGLVILKLYLHIAQGWWTTAKIEQYIVWKMCSNTIHFVLVHSAIHSNGSNRCSFVFWSIFSGIFLGTPRQHQAIVLFVAMEVPKFSCVLEFIFRNFSRNAETKSSVSQNRLYCVLF